VPELSPEQIQHVSGLGADFIRTERQNYAARAVNVPPELRIQVNPFFRPYVLHSTRVVVIENERVGNPEFYPELQALGFTNLPDFGGMSAITFHDVIVSHKALTPSLLFHELVHIEQYSRLGVDRFAEL